MYANVSAGGKIIYAKSELIHEMDDVCRRHGIEPKFAEMNAAPIKLYGDNDYGL